MFIDNVHWIKALFQSKEECLEWLQNRLRLCVYCRCHAPEIFPLLLGNRISYLCTLMKLALRASQAKWHSPTSTTDCSIYELSYNIYEKYIFFLKFCRRFPSTITYNIIGTHSSNIIQNLTFIVGNVLAIKGTSVSLIWCRGVGFSCRIGRWTCPYSIL